MGWSGSLHYCAICGHQDLTPNIYAGGYGTKYIWTTGSGIRPSPPPDLTDAPLCDYCFTHPRTNTEYLIRTRMATQTNTLSFYGSVPISIPNSHTLQAIPSINYKIKYTTAFEVCAACGGNWDNSVDMVWRNGNMSVSTIGNGKTPPAPKDLIDSKVCSTCYGSLGPYLETAIRNRMNGTEEKLPKKYSVPKQYAPDGTDGFYCLGSPSCGFHAYVEANDQKGYRCPNHR